MSEIMLFVSAVANHWLFMFGGIAMVAFGVLEKLRHKETAKWIFWGFAIVLLLVAFYQAWKDEHRNSSLLIVQKAKVWGDYNQCDKERAINDTLVKSCAGNLSYQQSRNDGQQDLFNRCMLTLGLKTAPEPTKIDVHRWKFPATYTYREEKMQFWMLVAIVNKPTQAKGSLKCDTPFTALASTLVTHGGMLRADYEQTDTKTVHVEYAYPLWSSKNPLVFAAFTPEGQEINLCSFKLD